MIVRLLILVTSCLFSPIQSQRCRDLMNDDTRNARPSHAWHADLLAGFDRAARNGRWDLGLMVLGWVHLVFFLVQHALHVMNDPHYWHFLALWVTEIAADLLLMRKICGKGWARCCPMAGLVFRIWVTFLILSFAVVALNASVGLETLIWYKNAWTVLSSFGFMMMAYLISARFFWLAVQMALTGLLIVRAPEDAFLIYGVSWCLALQIIGWTLRIRWQRAGNWLSVAKMTQARPHAELRSRPAILD